MGTDNTGKDILSRVMSAPRWDVTIAVLSTAISYVVGVILGVVSGFFAGERGFKGILSEVIARVTDIVQAFPPIVLALGLVAATGAGLTSIVLVVAFLGAPVFLRLTRAAALSVKERTYVKAARVAGMSDLNIMIYHVLPNSLGPPLANVSVIAGWAVLLTAGLSFIGAGVPVPTPEWGSMIAIGQNNVITGQWWPVLFPGLALGLTVLGFALSGELLRERFVERGREA